MLDSSWYTYAIFHILPWIINTTAPNTGCFRLQVPTRSGCIFPCLCKQCWLETALSAAWPTIKIYAAAESIRYTAPRLEMFLSGEKGMKGQQAGIRKGIYGLLNSGLATLLLCLSCFANGENLIDIYQLAVENDPTYRMGFHQNNASSEVYKQARALLLPTIDLEYSETETSQTINSSDNAVFGSGSTDFPTTEYTITINQSIYSYANWAGFTQAKTEVKRAASELEDVRQDLLLRVAERYFAVLMQQENQEYVVAEKSAIKQHYNLVQVKHKDGLARITDLAEAESRYMQAVADEIESGNDLDDSLWGIKEISGQLPNDLQRLSNQLRMTNPQPADFNEWVQLAYEQHPRIMMLRQAIEVARHEVRRQKGGHYPTLDLVLSRNQRETKGSLFGGGSDVETQDIMFRLNVPIFAGGAVSSKSREAAELHNKSKEKLTLEMRALERETLVAYQGVVGAIARVEALQKSVQAQELAVHAKSTAYEAGLATTLAVLDSERDLYLARRDSAQARYDYLLYTLRLKRAVGSLSEADLSAINELLDEVAVREGGVSLSALNYVSLIRDAGLQEQDIRVMADSDAPDSSSMDLSIAESPPLVTVLTKSPVSDHQEYLSDCLF